MKKIMILLAGAFLLTGCEVFTGTLNLHSDITFSNGLSKRELKKLAKCNAEKSTKRRCEKLRAKKLKNQKIIQTGAHRAKLKPGKKKIEVEILDGSGKKVQSFSVNVPKGSKLPKFSGNVTIRAADSGFNYDLNGSLNTEITRSENHRAMESCSWSETFEVCKVVRVTIPDCDPETDRRRCKRRRRQCRMVTETYYGQQSVEYFYEYTDKDLIMDILRPQDASLVADFRGQYHDTDKVYTFRGVCR